MPICKQLTHDCVRPLGAPGVLPVRGWIFSTPCWVFFSSFLPRGTWVSFLKFVFGVFLPEHPQRLLCHAEPPPTAFALGPQRRSAESDSRSWFSVPLERVSLLLARADWFTVGTRRRERDVYCVLWWFSLIMSWLGLPLLLYFYFYFSEAHMTKWTFLKPTRSKDLFGLFSSSFCSRLPCVESCPVCAGIAFPRMQFL